MGRLSRLINGIGAHYPTFVVCVCPFGSTLLHTTFMFYYVKIFLNVYRVNEKWFDVAQILYMIWNALNDPLFGYLQNLNRNWMKNRRKVILYGGPFFALSFLLPWFPWYDYETVDRSSIDWLIGLHLIVALFFYDGLFSFVMLAWCSLFAEITTDHVNRVRAMKYMQIAVLIGVNVLTVMDKSSKSLSDLGSFQLCSIFVALLAGLCFYYTGSYAADTIAQCETFNIEKSSAEKLRNNAANFAEDFGRADYSAVDENFRHQVKDSLKVSMQIFRNADFWRFVLMNALCVCRSTTHLNFAAIFTENLIPHNILPLGSWRISIFYGLCAVLPQIIVISSTSLVNKHGCYRLMMLSFVLSIVSGMLMFTVGIDRPIFIMLYMLIDAVTVHSFTPLNNVLCADLIDADMVMHKRRSPVSSVIFGLNALITKPGISLTPMVVVYFLDAYGYEQLKAWSRHHQSSPLSVTQNVTSASYAGLASFDQDVVERSVKQCMFALLCFIPVVLATCQWFVFRNYSLHTTHVPKRTIV